MQRAFVPVMLLSAWAGLAGGAAQAGAWPREAGETFLSFGGIVALSEEDGALSRIDPTIYLEYGLTERLTLGLDGYAADDGGSGNLFGWARLPLATGANGDVAAISAGAGAVLVDEDDTEAAARLGLHWGRGIEEGWLSIDAQALLALSSLSHEAKIDATWGQSLSPRWTGMLQGQVGYGLDGDAYAKLGASAVLHVAPDLDLRIGLSRAITGDPDAGLSVETWWRF
ncbi:hypothetical protein [Limimaricola hongkongensis]|uniref:Uncharacterized protein n=1 Tax=Limimaricola hongkongensis DSM 17492 TaxID=1122180 RepID=A0A017HEI7_9RHOB|nr:hypothetical protein [Limimaricola hongkongensis]EYD72204.1 hypothetical protein Lokhon_00996 [Limimaricola hongkongensis DSM 17492]